MDLGIENKIAIVCGGSKGIGYATAEALALEKVKVLVIARDKNCLAKAASDIRSKGGIVEVLEGDVADITLAEIAVEKCHKLWGSMDILVNNAGGPPMGTLLEHGDAEWELAIQTNFLSAVRFCRAALPGMLNNKWGRIISITSTLSKEPSPPMVLSATTRASVSVLMKTIALEYASENISANAICPGGVLTDRLISLMKVRAERENRTYEDILSESQNWIPAKRFAEPKEIANTALFLASEKGGYVNGVSLSVDGGLSKAFN